jgi:hypothetical protein
VSPAEGPVSRPQQRRSMSRAEVVGHDDDSRRAGASRRHFGATPAAPATLRRAHSSHEYRFDLRFPRLNETVVAHGLVDRGHVVSERARQSSVVRALPRRTQRSTDRRFPAPISSLEHGPPGFPSHRFEWCETKSLILRQKRQSPMPVRTATRARRRRRSVRASNPIAGVGAGDEGIDVDTPAACGCRRRISSARLGWLDGQPEKPVDSTPERDGGWNREPT